MSRFMCVLALVAVTLGLASVAAAAPPVVIELDETFPDPICGASVPDLTFSLKGTIRINTQNPHEEIQIFVLSLSYSANGKTLSSPSSVAMHITYNADGSIAQTVVTGLISVYTIPGQGAVLFDTGYIVFDGPFPTGPISEMHGHFGFFGGEDDLTAFCTYFADA
jgi:hypothetical protein